MRARKELAGALETLDPRCSASLLLALRPRRRAAADARRDRRRLGVTRERVRQLETRALRELRRAAPGLEHYLRAE